MWEWNNEPKTDCYQANFLISGQLERVSILFPVLVNFLFKWLRYGLHNYIIMNMFLECPISLYLGELSDMEQSVQHEKSEVNLTSWNAFGLEESEFVDCKESRDRKPTGLEIEEDWEESMLLQPSSSRDSKEETPTGKNAHKN